MNTSQSAWERACRGAGLLACAEQVGLMVTWHRWPMAPNSTALRSWALEDLVPAGKITLPAPSMKMDWSKWSTTSSSPKISWKCELRPRWRPGQVLPRRGRTCLVRGDLRAPLGLQSTEAPRTKRPWHFFWLGSPFSYFQEDALPLLILL